MSSTDDYFTTTVKCPYCDEKISVDVTRTQDNVTGEVHYSPQEVDCDNCGAVVPVNY